MTLILQLPFFLSFFLIGFQKMDQKKEEDSNLNMKKKNFSSSLSSFSCSSWLSGIDTRTHCIYIELPH